MLAERRHVIRTGHAPQFGHAISISNPSTSLPEPLIHVAVAPGAAADDVRLAVDGVGVEAVADHDAPGAAQQPRQAVEERMDGVRGAHLRGPLERNLYDSAEFDGCKYGGVPTGIRTRVSALKGPRPRPLDDGDVLSAAARHGGAAGREADRLFCHSLRRVPPPAAGLCASCVHAADVPSSKGATFILCRLSVTDPRFPRYPTLPVLRCAGYDRQLPDGGR